MVGKRESGGVRNKFMQVLLITGHPPMLYADREYKIVDLNIDGKTYHLGSIHEEITEHFKKVPEWEVIVKNKSTIRTKGLDKFKGLRVRKAGENTTIEISASGEGALFNKISLLKRYLEDNDIIVTERCSWVCNVDKSKQFIKEPVKKPVKEPTKEPVKKPVKEQIKEPIKNPVKQDNSRGMTEKTMQLNELIRKKLRDDSSDK